MFGEKEKQIVYIGSDHAGWKAKNELRDFLVKEGYAATDLGCFSEEPCDYPDIAREVGEKISENSGTFGILICGTGIGMSIAANKIKGVRAALAVSEEMAELARKHNNANVLAMGARIIDVELMKKIALKFLKTEFDKDEERHVKRVAKIE